MQVMKVISVAVLAVSVNANVLAGSSCDLSQVNENSAVDSVDRYYDRLSKGMNRDQLRKYYSGKQNELIDQTIDKLASDLKNEFGTEAQRFVDSMSVEAGCENLELTYSNVFGLYERFATLSYKVTPTCTDWKNNDGRTLKLRYSKTMCHWVITDILNEVKY